MKIKLPVSWEVCGFVEVEADSVIEAIDVFNDSADTIPLPEEYEYVDGSFSITCEAECIRDAYNPSAPID